MPSFIFTPGNRHRHPCVCVQCAGVAGSACRKGKAPGKRAVLPGKAWQVAGKKEGSRKVVAGGGRWGWGSGAVRVCSKNAGRQWAGVWVKSECKSVAGKGNQPSNQPTNKSTSCPAGSGGVGSGVGWGWGRLVVSGLSITINCVGRLIKPNNQPTQQTTTTN